MFHKYAVESNLKRLYVTQHIFGHEYVHSATPPHIWMRKWDDMAKHNVCDFENGALDTEFNLTPKGCLWQDQTTFSKLAKEAFKFDFESEEGFTFCASPPFNTLSTKKLKEIGVEVKTAFK